MRVTLIHNPEAGEGHPTPGELRGAFEAAGHRLRYVSSKDPGWEAAVRSPADLMVSAGGDGTVAKLVPLLAGSGVPLAVIPLGTANNIALTLGLSSDWRAVIGALEPGARRRFDCGTAAGPWGSTTFIESAGAGLVTHLIATADTAPVEAALSESPIPDRFDDIRRLGALLLHAIDAADYEIDADGVDLSGRYLLVEVMNIRSVGPRLRLAPHADPGDGMLDLVLIDESARQRFAADVESWLDNWTTETPWPVRRVRRASIAGRRLAWHVDDEPRPAATQSGPTTTSGRVVVEVTGSVELTVPQNGARR